MVTILTPVEKDSSVTMDSGAKLDTVGVPAGVLGYKRDRGVRLIFLGLKFSTPVFFWVEDLTVCFFGSEKSAHIFLGSNFRQANSSYAIKKVMYFFGSKISSLVFLWVHNIRSMYFFWMQNIRLRRTPPSRLYPSTPPGVGVGGTWTQAYVCSSKPRTAV